MLIDCIPSRGIESRSTVESTRSTPVAGGSIPARGLRGPDRVEVTEAPS